MKVPLLDLKAQYRTIKEEIDAAVAEVFESQYFILGPKVQECEAAVARYSDCAYAVGVSSGTDALLIGLMAHGVGPGDEVITTPYSFVATAGSITRVGAKPIFVDIDPLTYNINPALIEAAITERTKAVIPVHLYGQIADMNPILSLAARHGLAVIEDAAQAIGAEYQDRRAGSIGCCGCFSFYPSKNLGGAGDGGMVVTNNETLAEEFACLRTHGEAQRYLHRIIGGNFRLDALQAAVVTVKLAHLDAWSAARQANAARYDELLKNSGLPVGESIILPTIVTNHHIFNQYVIRAPQRDELRTFLTHKEIGTAVYYPVPLHLQECFAHLGGKKGHCPESERAARETIALPIYPEVTDEQAEYVVECIQEFYAARSDGNQAPDAG